MTQTDQAEGQAGESGNDLPGAGLAALDAIDAEVTAEQGGAAPGAAAGSPAAPAVDNAGELRQALGLLRVMAKPAFLDWPAYGTEVWNDPQLDAIAQHGGAIMDLNGWTLGQFWAKYGPYIAIVGAVLPPSMATYQHLRMRKALEAQRARQAEQRGNPVPPAAAPPAPDQAQP